MPPDTPSPSSPSCADARHRGIVVSHTHWDRAWYLPFEVFRHRLVRLVDRVMDLLEDNEDYRAFTLDGQTVLLEDYLEVRPDREDRLRRLIEEGRLFIGPWYTLPDLFLVSGEAVIRNLQEGHRLCEAFGGELPVGYIPDPFGHFAQMPQILRGFGLETYIFMRGLGDEAKERLGSVFNWEAPDGSTVRAVYQRKGYFPAAALGHPEIYGRFDGHEAAADLARERLEDAVDVMGPLQEEQTLLLSNGFDHMPEQPDLPELLEEVDRQMEDLTLRHGTLPEFVSSLADEETEHGTYRGDLIGNADHPILLSVYSARTYLKRQNHRAQQTLTRYAEPVSAWLDAEDTGPDARPFLRHGWKTLLRNHPHDDICGCSVDAVHEENENRFRNVVEVGESLLVEHLETLQKEGGFEAPAETGERSSDVFVFNPHPSQRRFRVETTVFMPNPDGERGPVPPAQPLSGRARGTEVDVTVLSTEEDVLRSNYLEATWGRRYEIGFEVTVPALGYQVVHVFERPETNASSGNETGGEAERRPSSTGERPVLENDVYRVEATGDRLRIRDKSSGREFPDGLRFEYQLDAGDTYSFGPVPEHGPWWATLEGAEPHPRRPDALRLHHRLAVPADYDRDGGPIGETEIDVQTDVHLSPHRAVSFDVRYENTARNGRLRAVFPTGTSTRTAWADGHFRLAEREKPADLTPEDAPERYAGYPGELNYPTQHQNDFVLIEEADARTKGRRTWVAQRGLPEYELLQPEGDTRIAVTLHRAVDFLSVEGGRIRRCQAGPTVPTPGAQCLRAMRGRFAFGSGTLSRREAVGHARAFAHPAWAREMPALPYVQSRHERPRSQSIVRIEGEGVELSAFKPAEHEETTVLRVYNDTARAQEARIHLGDRFSRWQESTLEETWEAGAGQPLEEGEIRRSFRPHEICTLLLR